MTARKTAAKNMNTVNELAIQFDGLAASLQDQAQPAEPSFALLQRLGEGGQHGTDA